jgi:hypothetical protein
MGASRLNRMMAALPSLKFATWFFGTPPPASSFGHLPGDTRAILGDLRAFLEPIL